jgi:hypothetical protein
MKISTNTRAHQPITSTKKKKETDEKDKEKDKEKKKKKKEAYPSYRYCDGFW